MANKILELIGIDPDPILGLDIGSTSIKMMCLSKKNEQIKVERYALEPLEPGIVVEKNIVQKEKVISAIENLMRKSKAPSKKVCVCIPSSASITRVIKMGADLSDKEIGTEIEVEAERYIPYPLDEINLDYTVIGPCPEDEGMVNVLLAVSKMENVENIVDIITEAGLTTSIVDIESFAIERAFDLVVRKLPKKSENTIVAVFDIGGTITTLNVFDNNRVIYTREQAFGGQQLVAEIEHRYGLTYDEAVQAIQYRDLPGDYNSEILEPFKQVVAQQISRFCQFFFSSGDYASIDYLLLAGGGSALPGMETVVQSKMQIKTFMANPFSDFAVARQINMDTFKRDIPRLINCCGLALRNLTER